MYWCADWPLVASSVLTPITKSSISTRDILLFWLSGRRLEPYRLSMDCFVKLAAQLQSIITYIGSYPFYLTIVLCFDGAFSLHRYCDPILLKI